MNKFDLEDLEKFVMDTIDMVYLKEIRKPKHYSAEGVKKLIIYRFQIYRENQS